jgi:hypothetical protein
MRNVNIPKEVGRAVLASVVAFFMAVLLKALGAGKWFVAAASGATGGVVALAAVA